MPNVTYDVGANIDSDVAKAAGKLEVMTYPKGMKFKVIADLPADVVKELGKDKLLAQDLWLGVKAIYDDAVARIGENLKKTDAGAVALRNAKEVEKLKKLIDVVNRGILGALEIAQTKAVSSVQANFDKLKTKRKEYSKYKIKIAVTITGAAVGLATSIALIAATGFSGGASGVIGIISMTKSVAVIASEVVSAAQSVEQSIATLKIQIAAIEKIWGDAKTMGGKAKSARANANEILAAVGKEFLNLPLPSAKNAKTNADTALAKLKGLEVNTHDMAKKVTKLMLESSAMQKDFIDKANAKLKKHPDPQAIQKYGPKLIGNLQKAVKPGNDQIKSLMLAIDTNLRRVKACDDEMKRLSGQLEEIYKVRSSSKFTENAYKVLDNALSIANNAVLGALSGNGLVQGAQSIAANVGPVVGLFAYDKISAVVFADGDLKTALW